MQKCKNRPTPPSILHLLTIGDSRTFQTEGLDPAFRVRSPGLALENPQACSFNCVLSILPLRLAAKEAITYVLMF